eukprot:1228382-Amphidinium_carterae.2
MNRCEAELGHDVTYSICFGRFKELYEEAMKKEWNAWTAFAAVQVVEASAVDPDVQIVGTRWVHRNHTRSQGQATPHPDIATLASSVGSAPNALWQGASAAARTLILRPPRPAPEGTKGKLLLRILQRGQCMELGMHRRDGTCTWLSHFE